MKKKAYAVIGLGRFGMPLAKKLAEAGKEVIGVDMDEERVKEFREFSEYAFVAKKLSKEVLIEIGIQNCDLFIYVGGESDAWVADVLESVGEGVRAVTLMDCVELLEEERVEGMEVEDDEHGDGDVEYDEHVWTSPRNAKLICEKIASALCEADPEGEAEYMAALGNYLQELDELDAAFKEVVANGVRDTVVFGDRFPLLYFAKAYGLEYYAAFPGCADETEPSAATVAFIIDKVREEGIPVVFHIELSNEDMADTICEETGAEKMLFSACHNVTRQQFEAGVTYLELMWQNVDALREALG